MSNPYLEKAASLYSFWHDVTGKEHADLKARKHHLEKAIANKDTVESLSSSIKSTGQKVFKARARVLGGAVGVAAAGLYGAKKYTDNQVEKSRQNMTELMSLHKKAAFLNFSADGLKRVSSAVGKKSLDVINTAHGGKIKQFAANKLGAKTPKFEKFVNANYGVKHRYARRFMGPDDTSKLQDLRTKQRVAQVGVYGGAAGVGAVYKQGKKKGRVEASQQMYY